MNEAISEAPEYSEKIRSRARRYRRGKYSDEASQYSEKPPPPSDPSPSPDKPGLSVDASGFSDAPVRNDSLGFDVYANGIAAFLVDEKTEPPLTMSVEGEWGSGKSSLMLQVQDKLRAEIKKRRRWNYSVISFNAWQNDKAESLWAAFALSFLQQLKITSEINSASPADSASLRLG